MKQISILNILIISISLFFFTACSEKEIEGFDANECYINFEKHTKLDNEGRVHDVYDKEFEYSFSLEESDFKSYVYKFVVILVGTPVNYDRPYIINVLEDQTTATASVYKYDSSRTMKAGELTDTVKVTLYRDPLLKEKNEILTLGLVGNDQLKNGVSHRQFVSLTISDQLLKPSWWDIDIYSKMFGPYYEEVYRKWMEIYYLGFENNIGQDESEVYYWNNMPPKVSLNPSSFPAFYAAVSLLKKYFFENDIYPNGDTSLPPIKIP